MNVKPYLCVAVLFTTVSLFGAETQERETFGKWRIGVGAAFNSQVRTSLSPRNMPVPKPYVVPVGSTAADALTSAQNRRFDGGGFIADDSLHNGFDTENWKLPTGDYQGGGHFVLNNAFQECLGGSTGHQYFENTENRNQFGISVEAARELWIHDEREDHRWGLDFVAAFSYFFARDVYDVHGLVTRGDTVRNGRYQTDVNDPDAMIDYDNGWDSPQVDPLTGKSYYGYGNFDRTFVNPALGLGPGNIALNTTPVYDPSFVIGSSSGYAASGDYQELEMLFMLRPWYEIYDWWRVFAQVGVGVSWGRFDSSFTCPAFSFSEDFAQWDCYGVAGLGTIFRYKRVNIMVDFLGRFLRDDLDVDGRYVGGRIERSNWGFRVMLGYEF